MFIQPTPGSMIAFDGKRLLFHSAPDGLLQYEELETGEIHKWKRNDFAREAATGAIAKINTHGTATSIAVIEPISSAHVGTLIGLTDHETTQQARLFHAFTAFQRSGLCLKRHAEEVLTVVSVACAEMSFKPVSLGQLREIQTRFRVCQDLLHACTPRRRGVRFGTSSLHKRDDSLIDQSIQEHYLTLEQPSIASAHRHYLRMREDDQLIHGVIETLPASLRTFERRVGRMHSFEKIERREGTPEARRRHRLGQGAYSDVRPMEVGEMDDCYIPVMVVSDDYSHALGTPRLCSLRDRGTGYVASYFLWCGEVSTFTALATFKNLLTDKSELLREAGLAEDAWPYCGVFDTIVIDRGPNLDAVAVVRAASALGSGVQMCPTKKPWAKPFVERLHAYVLEYIAKELPGRMFDDVQSFRSYKATARAVIPLSALIRILTHFFVEVINGVPRKNRRLSPTQEMATWMKDHPPALPCDPHRIDLMTAMTITRSVNQEGIRWENLQYVGEELGELVKRHGHKAKVKIYVNLGDLEWVTVEDPHTREQFVARCTWAEYARKLTLPEHQLLCRELHQRRERIRLAALIGLQRQIKSELATARQGKKLVGIAQKAERMQRSSETGSAPVPQSIEALIAPISNEAVLDSMLF